jgi:ATP-dependent protease HslVU (ClpYQ) peptidase subunit
MTCIVGVAKDGKVYLGGDSAGVSGLDITIRKDKKVFTNGEFVMGFTSSFRMGQILQYEFKPPEVTKDDMMEFMVCDFVPAIRQCFKEHGYSKIESNREVGGTFLVGVRGRLFAIQGDFQVAESVYGYQAVGCGEAYALGSLHATTEVKPDDRLKVALLAAEEFSGGVRQPFNFVTT